MGCTRVGVDRVVLDVPDRLHVVVEVPDSKKSADRLLVAPWPVVEVVEAVLGLVSAHQMGLEPRLADLAVVPNIMSIWCKNKAI